MRGYFSARPCIWIFTVRYGCNEHEVREHPHVEGHPILQQPMQTSRAGWKGDMQHRQGAVYLRTDDNKNEARRAILERASTRLQLVTVRDDDDRNTTGRRKL